MYKKLLFQTNYIKFQQLPLFYRVWMPDKPKGLILLIHGAGEHSGHYSLMGMECLKRNIALIAPDLRGFGHSGGHRCHVHKFQEYLQDLHQFLIHARRQYSGLPVFLCGYSLGGLIVIRYIQHFFYEPTGVILCSPAIGIRYKIPYLLKRFAELTSILVPRLCLEAFESNKTLDKFRFQSRFPDWTAEMMKDPMIFKYTLRWFTELLRNGTKALKEASKFHFPALCLFDLDDPVVDSEKIQKFHETISSSDKANIVFSQGNHQYLNHHRALEQIFQWLSPRLCKKR
ncbi:alpha/beta fold hydrolase [Ferviditalea candida]|uniref:alpha/beta fold hydrolase n=1 Tax=Ferviditalea candida TaxID=3108399 RepID=UPI00352CCC0A